MNMLTISYINPFLFVFAGAIVTSLISLFEDRTVNMRNVILFLTLLITASIYSFSYWNESIYLFDGLLLLDTYASRFGVLLLLILSVSIILIPNLLNRIEISPIRVISLLLFSASGGLCMIFANHLALFFVGTELMILPLYALVAFGKNKMRGSEASFKFFLLGSFTSAILIYGVGLIWASTGTMLISDISQILQSMLYQTLPKSFWFGMGLVLASLLFKMGIFPFHFWVADVFDAVSTSIQGWISVAISIASIGTLLRIFHSLPEVYYISSKSIASKWIVTLGMFSVLSMLWGSFGGLFQKNIKRLLGYSHVAHMGYLLMFCSVAIGTPLNEAYSVLFFYLCVYAFSNLVILFSLSAIEKDMSQLGIDDLKGLFEQSPVAATIISIAFMSLAGLPPLGGFTAKFKLFYFVISQGYTYLVVFAVVTSVISVGYYVSILSNILLENCEHEGFIDLVGNHRWILSLIAFLLLLVGVMPQMITSWM